jgi:uncharacterized protein with GYD domain
MCFAQSCRRIKKTQQNVMNFRKFIRSYGVDKKEKQIVYIAPQHVVALLSTPKDDSTVVLTTSIEGNSRSRTMGFSYGEIHVDGAIENVKKIFLCP